MSVELIKTPNVGYYPSEKDGLQFRSLGALETPNQGSLPSGFPVKLNSSLAWTRSEIAAEEDRWAIVLSSEEILAVEKALHHFKALALEPSQISTTTFPLPDTLTKRLDSVSEECHTGRGFRIVRGINPGKFTAEENVFLFAGISAHIAPERGYQDVKKSEVLCHIVNRVLLENATNANETPAFTEGSMVFHTDICDILAFYSIKVDTGECGASLLASSWQVYNELAATRPDIVATLSQNLVWDTFDDYAINAPDVLPPFAYHNEKLLVHCSRYPLTGFGSYVRNPTLPPITSLQLEALDAVHFTAQRNSIKLPSKVGDMIFINNRAMLHGREAISGPNDQRKLSDRHMMRLWLRDPKRAWGIPNTWMSMSDKVYYCTGDTKFGRFAIEPELKPITTWRTNG